MRLTDFAGRRVLLYFYRRADTPGRTKQACALRDIHPGIEERDVAVIGVGPDGPGALAESRAKCDLPFVLLSDPGHAAAEAREPCGERELYGRSFMGVLCTHIAIDGDGKVMEYRPKAKPLPTAKLTKALADE